MNDEDMKIYTPSVGAEKTLVPDSDDVKIYTCSSEPTAPAHSEQIP
ncbi:MAG: hypothetical protein J6U16_01860 [Ruminococcus sp.]|nr:hypothetical protein [Ruminococcus sp.]